MPWCSRNGIFERRGKRHGMAYSKAWRIIKDTEAALDVQLLYRNGAHGANLPKTASASLRHTRQSNPICKRKPKGGSKRRLSVRAHTCLLRAFTHVVKALFLLQKQATCRLLPMQRATIRQCLHNEATAMPDTGLHHLSLSMFPPAPNFRPHPETPLVRSLPLAYDLDLRTTCLVGA